MTQRTKDLVDSFNEATLLYASLKNDPVGAVLKRQHCLDNIVIYLFKVFLLCYVWAFPCFQTQQGSSPEWVIRLIQTLALESNVGLRFMSTLTNIFSPVASRVMFC